MTFYKTKEDGSLCFYSIHDMQAHFFSKYAFITIYGVNYRGGRERVFTFESRREMDQKLRKIFNKRIKDGYSLLYSYPRPSLFENIYKEQKQKLA